MWAGLALGTDVALDEFLGMDVAHKKLWDAARAKGKINSKRVE
jgi:hypothetical protein